jgi:hypothetical protein
MLSTRKASGNSAGSGRVCTGRDPSRTTVGAKAALMMSMLSRRSKNSATLRGSPPEKRNTGQLEAKSQSRSKGDRHTLCDDHVLALQKKLFCRQIIDVLAQ